MQKENLWFFILLLLSENSRYGYELRTLINDKFGFWSGNVTAYRVLYDLEKAKLVRAELQDRRRYYKITDSGMRELDAARAFLQTLIAQSDQSQLSLKRNTGIT